MHDINWIMFLFSFNYEQFICTFTIISKDNIITNLIRLEFTFLFIFKFFSVGKILFQDKVTYLELFRDDILDIGSLDVGMIGTKVF